MPHLVIDHSPGLEKALEMEALCARLREAARATGLFPEGGIRVRAHAAEACAIADMHPRNAYLHLTVAVGAGRERAALRAAGETIWTALEAALGARLDDGHFALSMEMREIDPDLSWKRNSIHRRLAAGQEGGAG